MSFWRLVFRSLIHHARLNIAVALGAAAATAVLTGALLVGDSVRGSLKAITLDRLGKIDEVLVVDRFFRTELATELEQSNKFPSDSYESATPVILFPNATVEIQRDGKVQRSGNVLLVGATDAFWTLDTSGLKPRHPLGDQIVLNEQLASQWRGKVGDSVTIRLPKPSAIPADSAYGRKTDNVISLPDLEVVDVAPNQGLGRFSLHPSQAQPLVAFVSIELLQAGLNQPNRANALLVAGRDPQSPPNEAVSEQLQTALKPTLDDFGFTVDRVTRTFEGKSIFDYYSFESDRMLISPEARKIADAAFLEPMNGAAAFTYFVNSVGKDGGADPIPYSLVAAFDSSDAFDLKRLAGLETTPQEGQILFTDWAAKDQNAKAGDKIEMRFFEPETSHGVAKERTAGFTLAGVVPLTEPTEPYDGETPAVFTKAPTIFNDPDFTPVVDGITDKDSIANLDVPFPFDIRRLREQDDTYWRNHRATPKAYVTLADGERLWGSRFGSVTSYRIPHREGLTPEAVGEAFLSELNKANETLGMEFQAVKRRGLQASSGTTPFDGLFLGLSMFIIAAALMLVSLLFRLGVEQRLSELGVLLASGFGRKRAARAFVAEGVIVALDGGLIGVVLGVGYAWLMLVGLRTVWVDAIATPFLTLHVTERSLGLGLLLGLLASSITILLGVRSAAKRPIYDLLAGRSAETVVGDGKPIKWRITAIGLLLAAIGLGVYGGTLSGEAQAGCFVGSGAAVLTSLLLLTWSQLRFGRESNARLSLAGLAVRNAGRNPSRSTTTIGLMAVATFLIVSMSAFRLDPSLEGAGGFQLSATSSHPIFEDLNSAAAKESLLADDGKVLNGGHVLAFRVKPGDDASCRNLYQSTAPIVLGVPDSAIAYFDDAETKFVFADSAATTAEQQNNPWRLLQGSANGNNADSGSNGAAASVPVPVILDKNTAAYSLHLMGGVGQTFKAEYDGYGEIEFQVVGLLSNSVLQGRLLISEQHFKDIFKDIDGYRYFLIRSPQPTAKVAEALEDRLGDQGFDTQSTVETLAGLLAVQNTYLSTFQALGSLGLLLGTFGLATVQLRSVLERRGELALMRASGFRRARVAWMVMCENASLLAAGLLLGALAAVIAIAPHIIATGADVPWPYLLGVLSVVFVIGLTSSITSVRATLRAPVIAALRGE